MRCCEFLEKSVECKLKSSTIQSIHRPDVFAGDDVFSDEDLVHDEGEKEAAQLGVVQVLLDQLLRLHKLDLPLDAKVALHRRRC